MHSRRRTIILAFVLVLIGCFSAYFPKLAIASRLANDTQTPEPYPNTNVYPAEVYLASSADLQVLYRLDIDLEGLIALDGTRSFLSAGFKPAVATVYIDPGQAGALARAGLNPVPIANEGYRSFQAYGPGSGAPNAWPTFDDYVTRMQSLANAHPQLVQLVQIGTSVQGRGLYCMEISDNPGLEENEPEFRYTANHHGDETTGVEMTMRLAELLANSYDTDPVITNLVDNLEIWICPIYNPDGYTDGTRYNDHGVDLNRDYPDRFTDPKDDPTGREPETQAFMNFGYAHRFVMGANYHGGAQVFNYPFDAIADPNHPVNAPDDQLFFDLGYGYTSRNPDLWNGGWPFGMTRGWEWYMIYGGMQDWAYYYHDEHHVTIEISNTKMPPFDQMNTYWLHNRDAMLWWMQQAMTGISGQVLDAESGAPLDASLTLVGRDVPNTVRTDPPVGDYHRVISAGDYNLQANAECYQSQTAAVSVISGTQTIQDFLLEPKTDLSASDKTASASHALPGNSIEYQVHLENTCSQTSALVTDTLPAEVSWTGYLTATAGSAEYESGQILWQGDVRQGELITITYGVSLSQCLPAGSSIENLADISDLVNDPISRTVAVSVDNALPTMPGSPIPADAAESQPITTTLSWSPSSDLNCDSITYWLYFDASNPPRTRYELTNPSFDPGGLAEGTTYYWYVMAGDGHTRVKGPIWRFTTTTKAPNELLRVFIPLTNRGE